MAITIQQQPSLYTPVYNPMMFVVSSSNYAQSNFKYLVDVYISGSTDWFRFAVDQDPNTTDGFIDVSRILESYVSSNKPAIGASGFNLATSSMIAYEVKFGEQYGVTSGITDYPNLTVTGTKYAFNGVLSPYEMNHYDSSLAPIETGGNILTDAPTSALYSQMAANSYLDLHFITGTSGTVYFAEIKTYDSSNALIGTYKIANPYQAVSAYSWRRQYFCAGTSSLNSASLYSGVQPVISASVYKYTVNLTTWSGSVQNHPTVVVYRDTQCLKAPLMTLYFKNKHGGFDTMEFTIQNRFKRQINRSNYERKIGTRSNHAWSYADADAGTVQYNTELAYRCELTSRYINDTESLWLMQLIESPEVYVDDGSSIQRCVIVSPTESEYKTYYNSDLFNIQLTIEYSQKEWRQRG